MVTALHDVVMLLLLCLDLEHRTTCGSATVHQWVMTSAWSNIVCYVGLQSKLWGVDAMPVVRASCRIGSVPGAVVKAVPTDASFVWEWR